MFHCNDDSLTYLAGLGYQVIRYPNSAFEPLTLLGHQNGDYSLLGKISQLITNPGGSLPVVSKDEPAPDIDGQKSGNLKFGVGVNIMAGLIGAMGGSNLGASLKFTNADAVQFLYQDVLSDSVFPLEVSHYLRDSTVVAGDPILSEYVQGNGDLYVLTQVIKSDKFSVKFTKNGGVDASVDVPVIQGAVGGNVSVSRNSSSSATLTFKGKQSLSFGFRCFHLDIKDGSLSMTLVKSGQVYGLRATGVTSYAEPGLYPANLMTGLLDIRVDGWK